MPPRTILAAVLAAVLAGVSAPGLAAGAPAHDHGHDHGAASRLHLNAGQKWATDAPLRQAMGQLRGQMAGALEAIHARRLPAADYVRLGGEVERAVADIVAQCQLPAEADAQLHLLVARLLDGAQAMSGASKHPKAARAGAVSVVQALDDYARYFDDPGFRPLAH